nr:LytTR family DNA-binding domain-containing protein [uncultured Faecalibacillus sp.]
MFNIAVVDDDQNIHQSLEEMISKILFKYPIPFKIVHFLSGNDFLNSNETFSLVILDVEMNNGDGIITKNTFKERTPIIFLSSYQDRMIKAFGSNVLAYLLKDSINLEKDLESYLIQIAQADCIYLDHQIIYYRDIVYLKADNVYTIIHTLNKDYLIRKSLKEMEKQLHFPFYRVHKSYIINFDYLKDINHLEITLNNLEVI